VKVEARNFGGWLGICLVGNTLVLLAIVNWFPAAGLDIFNFQHVRLVALAAFVSALVVVISAAALLLHRRNRGVFWIVSLLQVLAFISAFYATASWPGSDDGPGIGWEGIVLPSMALLAAFATIGSLLAFSRPTQHGKTEPGRDYWR